MLSAGRALLIVLAVLVVSSAVGLLFGWLAGYWR